MLATTHSACAVLSNRDILLLIIVRCDDSTLEELYLSALQTLIHDLLSSQLFWYLRSQFLSGKQLQPRPDVDWHTIFYSIIASSPSAIRDTMRCRFGSNNSYLPHIAGLRHLDSLYVLIEIYGEPRWEEWDLAYVWTNIRSKAVLDHLVSLGLLSSVDEVTLRTALECYVTAGCDEMVEVTLDLMPDPDISDMHQKAVNEDRLSTFILLCGRHQPSDRDYTSLLRRAAEHGSVDVLRHLLEVHTYEKATIQNAMSFAIDGGSAETLTILLRGVELSDTERCDLIEEAIGRQSSGPLSLLVIGHEDLVLHAIWRGGLENAIYEGEDEMVNYILGKIDLSSADSDLLAFAASNCQRGSYFGQLLDDGRLDPMRDVDDLVEAIKDGVYREMNYGLLLRDERVNLDRMSRESVETVYDTLLDTYRDELGVEARVNGFRCGLDLVDEAMDNEELRAMVTGGGDVYSRMLRQIVLLGPGAEGLVDWMITSGNRELETAAISTLVGVRHRDWEVMTLRALMMCMLYPSRDMSEMEAWMREEKYDGKALMMSSGLLGAYLALGSSGRVREAKADVTDESSESSD